MTQIEQIKAEIERLLALPEIGFEDGGAEHGYKEALLDIKRFIHSLPEEPVSEDLGQYINELSKQFPEVSFAKLSRICVRVKRWLEKAPKPMI